MTRSCHSLPVCLLPRKGHRHLLKGGSSDWPKFQIHNVFLGVLLVLLSNRAQFVSRIRQISQQYPENHWVTINLQVAGSIVCDFILEVQGVMRRTSQNLDPFFHTYMLGTNVSISSFLVVLWANACQFSFKLTPTVRLALRFDREITSAEKIYAVDSFGCQLLPHKILSHLTSTHMATVVLASLRTQSGSISGFRRHLYVRMDLWQNRVFFIRFHHGEQCNTVWFVSGCHCLNAASASWLVHLHHQHCSWRSLHLWFQSQLPPAPTVNVAYGMVWYGMVWYSQSNYVSSWSHLPNVLNLSQPMVEEKCIWLSRDLLTHRHEPRLSLSTGCGVRIRQKLYCIKDYFRKITSSRETQACCTLKL